MVLKHRVAPNECFHTRFSVLVQAEFILLHCSEIILCTLARSLLGTVIATFQLIQLEKP